MELTPSVYSCRVRLLKEKGSTQWPRISFDPSGVFLGVALCTWAPQKVLAQNQPTESPASPGFSFETARAIVSPVTDVIALVLLGMQSIWHYIATHGPVATLLAAIIGSTVAIVSIRSQRTMTRVRETFAAMDRGNWDGDLIKARVVFSRIKNELRQKKESIAKYCNDDDGNDDKVTLQTIMNDYENLALGVRANIIDELYLYRWMRTILISDWHEFSPLVTAYRHQNSSQTLYIEFEGLASAWSNGRSYRTGRKLKRLLRTIKIS